MSRPHVCGLFSYFFSPNYLLSFCCCFLCFPSYAFLVCHFIPVDYLWIAPLTTQPVTLQFSLHNCSPRLSLLLAVVAHGWQNHLTASYNYTETGQRPWHQPTTLSSEWPDESAAASLGMTWKPGKSLSNTCAASLPLGGVGFPISVCSHSSAKWWCKPWMAPVCYRPKGLQDTRKGCPTWNFMLEAISFWSPWAWSSQMLNLNAAGHLTHPHIQ